MRWISFRSFKLHLCWQQEGDVINLEEAGDDTPLGPPDLGAAMGSQPSQQELIDGQLAAALQEELDNAHVHSPGSKRKKVRLSDPCTALNLAMALMQCINCASHVANGEVAFPSAQ